MIPESAVVPWSAVVRHELTGNILPFWMNKVTDPDGGFYGQVDSNGIVDRSAPRAAVLNTRILWTFSAATRLVGPQYQYYAERAYNYLIEHFIDRDFGGLFWMVDSNGETLSDRKQIYAQAFGLYAFSEYAKMSGSAESLELAMRFFGLIEEYGYDPIHSGYIEALKRNWQPLNDMRLSEKDLNTPKSMNTHLHIMESYTNLIRLRRDPLLMKRQADLNLYSSP